jgi:hypothetical protein
VLSEFTDIHIERCGHRGAWPIGPVVMTFICSISSAVRVAFAVLAVGVMTGIYLGVWLAQV